MGSKKASDIKVFVMLTSFPSGVKGLFAQAIVGIFRASWQILTKTLTDC
jgi:hypothetical protein